MAANKWPDYAQPVSSMASTDSDISRAASKSLGGTGGGGSKVDPNTKNYVDKSMESVKAQNDARFAEVLARFDVLKSDIDNKPVPPSIWQIAGVVAAGIGALVAIAAFSYDRFDGGIAAGALVDQAVSQIEETQAKRDKAQDQRLNQILEAIVGANDQSQESPEVGQD